MTERSSANVEDPAGKSHRQKAQRDVYGARTGEKSRLLAVRLAAIARKVEYSI
jgi:hypothetical protein